MGADQPNQSMPSFFYGPFIWGTHSLGEFYEESMGCLWNCFYAYFYGDKEDFDDIFQEAMYKLTMMIEKGKSFTLNVDAYLVLRKIFYNKMIDKYRRDKKLRLIINTILYENRVTSYDSSCTALPDSEKGLKELFIEAEKLLQAGVVLFTPTQLEFYYYFKPAIWHFVDQTDIKFAVVSQLEISDSKYYNLKSKVIAILRNAMR